MKHTVLALPFAAALVALPLLASSPARAIDDTAFQTPSGNIHCVGWVGGGETTIECDLLSRTNDRPARPRPGDCDLEWGSRFILKNFGRTEMGCTGDSVRNDEAPTLRYDMRLDYYGIACTATRQGLECINDDGHGFKIARARQDLY
ncbi:MAG: hypothetical protein MUC58_08765 [Rhizobiaceae bacterium]|jgi:hypothetical protein|nr:hypothetical protein [Rhizobiaceae bacterium]